MVLVFDTNTLSGFLGKDDTIIEIVARSKHDRLVIPLATDAELRYGFMNGNRNDTNLIDYETVKDFLSAEVIAPDHDTSKIYAELATWLDKNGISLSNNDIWIAATCIQVGGSLLTLDKDFTRLPQIRLINT